MPTTLGNETKPANARPAAWDTFEGKTAVVTGGSRGFGRGIVEALAGRGMRVIAVARDKARLAALARDLKGVVETVAADATDGMVAAQIVERERPHLLVLNAGANGTHRPTRFHTWETFSAFWQTDVKAAFLWTREALLLPLDPGSVIVVSSSNAATTAGFPLVSSYASAKSALWTFSRCLAAEAGPLGLRVHCLLPSITVETDMGRDAIAGFARRLGVDESQLRAQMVPSPPLTPKTVGAAVVRILSDPACAQEVGFRITPQGIERMSEADQAARR